MNCSVRARINYNVARNYGHKNGNRVSPKQNPKSNNKTLELRAKRNSDIASKRNIFGRGKYGTPRKEYKFI